MVCANAANTVVRRRCWFYTQHVHFVSCVFCGAFNFVPMHVSFFSSFTYFVFVIRSFSHQNQNTQHVDADGAVNFGSFLLVVSFYRIRIYINFINHDYDQIMYASLGSS